MSRSLSVSLVLAAAVAAWLWVGGASRASLRGTEPPRPSSVIVQRLDFQAAPLEKAWPDNTTWGKWKSLHDGFGVTSVVDQDGGRKLQLSTRTAASDGETFSSLVRSVRRDKDVDFTTRLQTVRQLRATPNPW